MSVHDLGSALGRLSVKAALTIGGVLAAIIGGTFKLTQWIDQQTITTLRDSVRAEQRAVGSLRARGDSLVAVLKQPQPKASRPAP